MKKLILFLSIALMVFAFISCDGNTKQPPGETPSETPTETPSGTPGMTTHTVTFLVDGKEYAKNTVGNGNTVAMPADPRKEGSTFTGWLLDGKPFAFDTPITGDITLNACWNKVIVTFRIADALYEAGDIELAARSIIVHPGYKQPASGILTLNGNPADVIYFSDEDGTILTPGTFTITENTTLTITDFKTEENKTTFYISTFDGLKAWADSLSDWRSLNNCFLLSDIIMPEPESADKGNWTAPTYDYCGTFDGKGHTISGLIIKNDSLYYGFFYSNEGTIKNINFKDVVISSDSYCGTITGYNAPEGIIQSCSVTIKEITNTKTGNHGTGGIVGNNQESITDCYSVIEGKTTSAATGEAYLGGIAGLNETGNDYKGIIADCYTIIEDGGSIGGSPDASGGIVGRNFGQIIGCHSIINGKITTGYNAGGITGGVTSSGEIKGCYSIVNGSISGQNSVGGITGECRADVTGCYAVINGSLESNTGGNVGGVCGELFTNGNISSCYWTGNAENGVGTGDAGEKTVKVDNNDWTGAMEAMDAALAGSGYQYELNAYADKDTIPLVLVHVE